MLGRFIHDRLVSLMRRERRHEPLWRPLVNELLREPSAALIEALLERRREKLDLSLAEERYVPGEDEAIDALLAARLEQPEAGGRSGAHADEKLHGLLRAELSVSEGLPRRYRKGIFAKPRRFPAWVCFSGPGPESLPDIQALGGPRMSVKLMQVPGRKLLDDEKHTQDLCGISTPTSPAPTVLDSVQLEAQRRARTPLYYFLDPRRQHLLELLLLALYEDLVTSPLECRYYGAAPFLLGQGQAMQYSLRPRAITRTPIPELRRSPPDHYLRQAMQRTLAAGEVSFDLLIQVQTDAHAMPIEDAGVRWPERLSPWLTAATLRFPQQEFDGLAQRQFAKALRFTPWHALPEHRPLGNQNRALRRLYLEQLELERRSSAPPPRVEPTGDEVFDELADAAPSVASEPSVRHAEPVARSSTRQVATGGKPAVEASRVAARGRA
jgi:hypothetical protein